MSNIVRRQGNLPNLRIEGKVAREVERQMAKMERITDLAIAAMDEVSNVHSYGTFKAATTLSTGQVIKQAAGALSLEERAALGHLDWEYLREMAAISKKAGSNIVLSLEEGASRIDTRNGMEKVIDWLKTH